MTFVLFFPVNLVSFFSPTKFISLSTMNITCIFKDLLLMRNRVNTHLIDIHYLNTSDNTAVFVKVQYAHVESSNAFGDQIDWS